jgi:DNA-binding transcriptional ArsR family regulator
MWSTSASTWRIVDDPSFERPPPPPGARRQELDALSAGICKALNHPRRLVLLYALRKRPHTVSELCEVIQASPSNTSSHLAVLRRWGLVEAQRQAQRQGNSGVYCLRHPKVIDAIDLLRQVMNEEIARQQALRASPPPGSRR